MKSEFQRLFFPGSHKRPRDYYTGKHSMIIRPFRELNTHCFNLISGFFHGNLDFHLSCRFSLNIPVVFENWGGLNPRQAKRSNASFCVVFGAFQLFLILILSVPARHVNLIQAQTTFLCGLLCKKLVGLLSHCERLPYASSMRESPS